jgi:hypothetical protein
MTNYEKYKDKIIRILEFGIDGGFALNGGKPVVCDATPCDECDFGRTRVCEEGRYASAVADWLNAECVELPKLSKAERAYCEALKSASFYISRDKDGDLCIHNSKPYKALDHWQSSNYQLLIFTDFFNVSFDFIKWEDSEPWRVEDLLKLEVKECG